MGMRPLEVLAPRRAAAGAARSSFAGIRTATVYVIATATLGGFFGGGGLGDIIANQASYRFDGRARRLHLGRRARPPRRARPRLLQRAADPARPAGRKGSGVIGARLRPRSPRKPPGKEPTHVRRTLLDLPVAPRRWCLCHRGLRLERRRTRATSSSSSSSTAVRPARARASRRSRSATRTSPRSTSSVSSTSRRSRPRATRST